MRYFTDNKDGFYAVSSDFIPPVHFIELSASEGEAIILASIVTPSAQELADKAAIAFTKSDTVIQYLATHTPAECSAYVATNVTNLATAVSLLQKMSMALCVLVKGSLR